MNNTAKNIIISSSITTAGLAALTGFCCLSATCLTKIALDRVLPASINFGKKRISGSRKVTEFHNQCAKASETLEKIQHEKVYIKSFDGLKLTGHWFGCDNPQRIIIAMHGWRSGWARDFGVISEFFLKQNCAVLYAEQRGQGESEGDYMSFGLLERFDCLEWIKWACKKSNNKLPVYLCGISMGASTVLMTGGLPLPKNVCGIIADCGFTSPNDIWRHVVKNNLKIPYDIYSPMIDGIVKKKLDMKDGRFSCTTALKNCKTPVLFIHGSDDRFVPVWMTYENFKSCSSPKRLLIVPGATHGLSYLFNQRGYELSCINFWKDYDKKWVASYRI